MGNKFEKNTLRILFILGIGAFFNLIRKPPMKEWIIIFLLKSYIASILDNILVKKGYFKYPVNLFKIFDISALFSYLLFPIICIYFNQITKNSNIKGILFKCLLFSLPSALAEHWLERKTKLIKYKKSWTSVHSFFSIAFTFLMVRFLMTLIRTASQKQ
ncbi:CBO0543 family protein [Neobacillus bataviensis]|uniref:CBO0543 family protein n=1 Tax=Neobacillus bataviensis TaxID=220685 RepID=UPI001CBE21EE|nr:CBO0543 family protein [Neobacillus bataviensis]